MCLVYKHMNCHKDHTHIKCAGRTSVARLHDRTPVRYAERTPARWCVCEKSNYEWWGGMSTPRPIGY
jgi:hypothetical protein